MINTIQERIIKQLCNIFDCPQVSLWAYLLTDRLLISIPFFRNNFRPQDARPFPNARCAPGELYIQVWIIYCGLSSRILEAMQVFTEKHLYTARIQEFMRFKFFRNKVDSSFPDKQPFLNFSIRYCKHFWRIKSLSLLSSTHAFVIHSYCSIIWIPKGMIYDRASCCFYGKRLH